MVNPQLMTDRRPHCAETVLRCNAPPSARASGAPRSVEFQEITPTRLADLMVAAPLLLGASLVSLQPEVDTSKLLVRRGRATLAEVRVPVEIGNAAVARVAFLAGLDPFAAAGSFHGSANVARLRARAGGHIGEVLVSVVAQSTGFEVEIRPLTVNGRAPDLHVMGRLKRCRRCRTFQAPARQTCALDGGALEDIEDAPMPGGTVGPYRVLSLLGEGGVGTVFAGEHALIERPVAIKLLHRVFASNPRLVHRFLSEARAASRLHHPNIVDVTDFGLLVDGRPYMVMERLDGESLEARLFRVGALEPVVALQIAREMVVGLCAAHQAGVTHNDLKPANVMLLDTAGERAPRLKLIDFGAAAVVGMPEELMFGTPGYMAPERMFNEPSDGRADVYAVGVILYEMLKGSAPFKDLPQEALILAHVQKPLPPLDSPFGLLPPPVIHLVARAVAKKADGRHQSAAEMLADIDRAISSTQPQGWRRWLP